MTVQVNDIARVTADITPVAGTSIQNVFHLRNVGSAISELNATADITEILDALYALLAAIIQLAAVINTYRAINKTQNSDIGIGIPSDTTPFTGSGDVDPLQACFGLNLTTARLNVYGRKFFGPTLDAKINSFGLLDSTAILALADVGDYMTAIQAATNSSWEFGVEATEDAAWLGFQSYTIPVTATTQRRRRIGVGI